MSLEFSLTFVKVQRLAKVKGFSDVVKTIHWRLTASDGEKTVEEYGSVTLDDPKPGASFKAFRNIKRKDLTAWVEEKIDIGKRKERMSREFEQPLPDETIIDGFPWE